MQFCLLRRSDGGLPAAGAYARLQQLLAKLFYVFWTLLFCVAFFGMWRYIFVQEKEMHAYAPVTAVCTLAFAALLLGAALLLKRVNADALSGRTLTLLILGASVIMTVLCVLTAKAMPYGPFSDAGTIYYSAAEALTTGHVNTVVDDYTMTYYAVPLSNNDYFMAYPNTIFSLHYVYGIYRVLRKLFGILMYTDAGLFTAVVLNSLHIGAGVCFAGLAVKEKFSGSAVLLYLLLAMLFVPYYINAYRMYTDTLPLPYLTFAVFLLFCSERYGGARRAVVLAAAGLSAAAAGLLKPSLYIPVIAAVIYLFLTHSFRGFLCRALPFAGAVLLAVLVWNSTYTRLDYLDFTNLERYREPPSGWLMMASTGSGGFHTEDFTYIESFETYEEKNAAALAEWKARVSEYSPAEYASHLLYKAAVFLRDGLFSQRNYLAVFDGTPAGEWLHTAGRYYPVTYVYTTAFLCMQYLFLLLGAAAGIRRREITPGILFHIALTGAVLFFTLWESKSRYLLTFTPFLLMLTAAEAVRLRDMAVQRTTRNAA